MKSLLKRGDAAGLRGTGVLVIGTALLVLSAPVASAGAEGDLMAMARTLAEAERFDVTMSIRYDSVQPDGRKLELSEVRGVQVARPARLRVDTARSDGEESNLFFDGQTLTLYSGTENVYSQTEGPTDLDGAVRFAVGRLGVRVPLARMLSSSLVKDVERLARNVTYIERNRLGESSADHIAVSGPGVDYQFWIGDDALLRRVVLTYRTVPGQPQFRADFTGWNFAPPASDARFEFHPPGGARRIPTLLPGVSGGSGADGSEGREGKS